MDLRSMESTHWFAICDGTGQLDAVGSSGWSIPFDLRVDIEIGGVERRGSTGGLEYDNTQHLTQIRVAGTPKISEQMNGRTHRVPVLIESIQNSSDPEGVVDALPAALLYQFHRVGPALSLGIEFSESSAIVRNVVVRGEIGLQGDWVLTGPGNGFGGAVPLPVITSPVGVSPLGGLRGSSGLVHLACTTGDRAIALWFDNDVEIPEIELRCTPTGSLAFTLTTNFAADLGCAASNVVQLLSIDLDVPQWSRFPAVFSSWLRSRGFTAPGDPPPWIAGALIYEAQIGFSIFNETNRYSPYAEVDDLTNDLDRVRSLGFSVIQLMPRQPYPSYNIHDYRDIATSYGPVDQMRRLVEECHRRGMHIILDVLLHGVLDQESIGAAADGVRSGPYADLVGAETSDSFSGDVNDWTNYLIAWSRHILDFEPHWRAGSVPISPLVAEHPDWFCRDSSGNVSGVYTKAFDARNREWQAFFTDAMVFLMTELGIDGFRFDAPTYNDFPNYASWARGRAGSSALSCVGLFERLRPVLRSHKADALLYTEPSGHSLRRSMDLNYNYDEQWLVTALADSKNVNPWAVKNAKGLAAWMRDRDALLPTGSMTAHHIDSHDTFWWPTWGKKWRREQFGLELTRLLTFVFASLPGPFMMFTGGEIGIEDLLPALAELKATSHWKNGAVSWWCGTRVPDSLFGTSRTSEGLSVSVFVNFADHEHNLRAMPPDAQVRFTVGGGASCNAGVLHLGPRGGAIVEHHDVEGHGWLA